MLIRKPSSAGSKWRFGQLFSCRWQYIFTAALALACVFTLSCSDGSGLSCNGTNYDPSIYRCEYGEVIGKCNGEDYYPANQQCVNGVVAAISDESSSSGDVLSSSSETPSSSSKMPSSSSGNELCDGTSYDPGIYRCEYGEIIGRCNGKDYYLANQQCVNGVVMGTGDEPSSTSELCGDASYDPGVYRCEYGEIIGRCNGKDYYSANQFCSIGIVYPLCGGATYNPATQFCLGGAKMDKCDGEEYLATEFCYNDKVESKCGGIPTGATYNLSTEACCGSSKYAVATQFCQTGTNAVKPLCGTQTYTATEQCCSNSKYTTATQFCNGNVVYNKCGGNEYDPSSHYCKNGTTPRQYDGSKTYAGKTYNTIVVGTQTWLAENLNYDADGSKCYNNQEINCDKYGRLYDWSTAMGFAAACNSSSCSEQIETPHQGICPDGWHIPSNADWNELYHYADGTLDGSTNLSSNYDSPTAGKYLKATSGWNGNGNGLDTYGFSALPGGGGNSGGNFASVGSNGNWWSASENNSYSAYNRGMYYYYEDAYYYDYYDKGYLQSVRCLQD